MAGSADVCRGLRLGDDCVLDAPDPLDFDADDVALDEELERVEADSDARGCARRDDVTRFEREGGRQMLDQVEAVEDQVTRVGVLAQFAVDIGAQVHVGRVDFIGRGQKRAERTKGVETFGFDRRPVIVGDEIAYRQVVSDGISLNMIPSNRRSAAKTVPPMTAIDKRCTASMVAYREP